MKTCKDHLALISKLAEEQWNDKWQLEIVRAYVGVINKQSAEQTTVDKRKTTIARVFNVGSCTADTLITLYAAVNCEIQINRQQQLLP